MKLFASASVALLLVSTGLCQSQHLWWDLEKQDHATCVYGEITVLATHPAIYYCGANWHPGQAAGGYCGIQHNSLSERRTIFSIWDTTPTLHPVVTFADPQTLQNRFGGEGEGGHTHMLWDWHEGDTFQFFVHKKPGATNGTTDACYYIFDRQTKQWRHSATITSPNGDEKAAASVTTIGGGSVVSFLENFLGREKDIPKLALYRLWLGDDAASLKCLTKARGDGKWGELHDTYFLAEGETNALNAVFTKLESSYGKPIFGQKGTKLDPITDKPLSPDLVSDLKNLK